MLASVFALVAVVALFLAGIAAESYRHGGPAGPVEAQAGAKPAAPKKKATPSHAPEPGVGDKVRDGKFEFVVSKVDCSKNTVGLEHFERTATGRYCVVSLSARNFSSEPKYFVGHAQKAIGADGTEYGNDELASIYANRATRTFLQKLDPGERVTGKLVFDVPKTAKLTTLVLHDSLLSGGVTVKLR
ncbi:DUF4352 domain-containing protein [Paractinoplanes bogorensis]|uniref:DUF4352 domain-containing protein n=1 Tax=Paractinoplanes bogorensis TaxID=1610840 RepID=UPI0027DFB1E4|nr:DUF4352 domain-containing protein [Actinoplanes bogorensis]